MFPKVAQKVGKLSCIYVICCVFIIAPKPTQYFDYFCHNISCQELSKTPNLVTLLLANLNLST